MNFEDVFGTDTQPGYSIYAVCDDISFFKKRCVYAIQDFNDGRPLTDIRVNKSLPYRENTIEDFNRICNEYFMFLDKNTQDENTVLIRFNREIYNYSDRDLRLYGRNAQTEFNRWVHCLDPKIRSNFQVEYISPPEQDKLIEMVQEWVNNNIYPSDVKKTIRVERQIITETYNYMNRMAIVVNEINL